MDEARQDALRLNLDQKNTNFMVQSYICVYVFESVLDMLEVPYLLGVSVKMGKPIL